MYIDYRQTSGCKSPWEDGTLSSSSKGSQHHQGGWFSGEGVPGWRKDSYVALQRAADWIIAFRKTGLEQLCSEIYIEVCKYEHLIGRCKCELDDGHRREVDRLKRDIEMSTVELLGLCMKLMEHGRIPKQLLNRAMFPPS